MPHVVGIGAFVTINHWQRRMSAEQAVRLDDTVANFCVRHFAKLDTGDVVFAPPPGMGLGVPRDELAGMDFSAFSAFVSENVTMDRPEHLTAGHGHVYMERWERLATELHPVVARPEDLIDMPFETVIEQDVRQLLAT